MFIIAGPCSIDTEDNLDTIARSLSSFGITHLRAGAFKPRTSPYTFKGLGSAGIQILHAIASRYSMLSVSEITDISELDDFARYIDIIQIGARNMQNFPLLEAVARLKKPIIIKRGFMSTIDELMYACEYAVSCGNDTIIICERGIRTFQKESRFSLDITSIPAIQAKTDFPVIVDPSHSTGKKDWVERVSYAAIAAGADGLMFEVHNAPHLSLSDEQQIVDLPTAEKIASTTKKIHALIYG